MIHLQPLKTKIEWQDRIDKTVDQCKGLLEEAAEEEKKVIRKRALHIIPDSSLFDSNMVRLEEEE